MNVARFLQHHNIATNPFRDEEARHDDVFTNPSQSRFEHAEASKIIGDLNHPSSAVVFGEKGSGKTAIRLQIEEAIHRHNAANAENKSFIIAYDDLNPILDRFARHLSSKDADKTLSKLTLNDHIDGILATAVPTLIDAALPGSDRIGEAATSVSQTSPTFDKSKLRKLDNNTKRDWAILQTLYDRPDQATRRGSQLTRRLRLRGFSRAKWLRRFCILFWLLAAITYVWYMFFPRLSPEWAMLGGIIALIVLAIGFTGIVVADLLRLRTTARKLSNQLRVLDRNKQSFRHGLEQLPHRILSLVSLPTDDIDETRYEMLVRFRRAVRPFGFVNLVVLLDRVDEPSLVRGEASRMRSVVWPMLDNKFLQQPNIAIKMMLPLELRYALYGQSKDFFQQARLDKQNMIDKLEWSGITLFDLCNSRIAACTEDGNEPVQLTALFEGDVSRDEIVKALDQMRQPRDAFKLLYNAIQHHCNHASEDDQSWHIDRNTLETALARQKERLDALRSGLGPA